MANPQIVTVWLDETSEEHAWIVDTSTKAGGESQTLRTFPPNDYGRGQALQYAKQKARQLECDLHEQSSFGPAAVTAFEDLD